MAETLRVGIIGVGWGALVHGPAYGLVDGYELVALCGRRPEPLATASERLGITDTSNDWGAFVRRDDIDLVSIVLPVELHKPVLLAALEAGKHVLCEKPLSLTGEEGRDMVRAAESSDRQTAVCFQNRWSPERLAMWELVANGGLGQPYFVQASGTAPYWHPTRPLQSEWMYHLDAGGGYLSGMASHDLDYIQTLFGRVVSVTADVRSSIPQRPREDGSMMDVDADDTSALVMRTESGALAVLTTSVVGYQAGANLFTALGSDGTIEIARVGADGASVLHRVGEDGPRPVPHSDRMPASGRPIPPRRAGAAIHSLALMLEDWLPAFDGEATRVPSIRGAWQVEEVIDAARRSSAGAGWVDVPATP
jgi:predicted dehydrogenase